MKKKVAWMVVSGWMVAALLLASCAPAVVEEEKEVAPPVEKEVPEEVVVPKEVVVPGEGPEMIKWTGKKLNGTAVEKMIEKPKYGGIHIVGRPDQPVAWDDTKQSRGWSYQTGPVNECLILQEWTRGPAGSEEWIEGLAYEPGMPLKGSLCTDWERPDPDTLVYHIRQGVHWTLDPNNEASALVGGRQMTADDVVFSLRRIWTIGYHSKNYTYLSDMENPENSIYVSPDDPWAVVIKAKPGGVGLLFRHAAHGRAKIVAPEVVEKYGGITEWEQTVGTGAFMIEDYVDGSSISYVRNPNYWRHDPFFPENQLPYLDGFKILIIPDKSTQEAGLRTGKLDYLTEFLSKEGVDSLLKTNPELQTIKFLGTDAMGGGIYMRNDRPDQPWHDVRVRRALHMGINNQEILDGYWGGDGEVLCYPVAPKPISINVYIPLEEMPESVQEQYGYHPDKAKELLAEAGYPDGFTASIIAEPRYVDLLSIIKNYWAKIGVDLNIEIRDQVVYASIRKNKSHEEMIMDKGSAYYASVWASYQRTGGGQNFSIIDDPWCEIMVDRVTEAYFDPAKKVEIQTQPMGEGVPSWPVYVNEQCWFINLPRPYQYYIWQPYLKGHSGGFKDGFSVDYGYAKFCWLDQELKEAMGY
ncbi:ABC transporter substrate-binding protein [Chloroflexota bacterium]